MTSFTSLFYSWFVIEFCFSSPADILATSLSLLGNHMFPERKDNAAFNRDGPTDTVLPVCPAEDVTLHAGTQSEQVTRLEADGTESQECEGSASTQPSGAGPEDAGADREQGDSGEFVVTMLAKAKLEEQGIGVKGRSSPLLEAGTQDSPALVSHRDEDVTADSWRQHRKHVFVLSEAGKPIYSRYGSEEALSSTMGVMMALVSFVQSGDNIIRSVYSGTTIVRHFVCFACGLHHHFEAFVYLHTLRRVQSHHIWLLVEVATGCDSQ